VHCWFNGWLGSTNISEKHSRAIRKSLLMSNSLHWKKE
jgi:hypothetical protein